MVVPVCSVVGSFDQVSFQQAAYNRTEAGFVSEFIHLWLSEVEATVKIECKERKVAVSMNCLFGRPKDLHI